MRVRRFLTLLSGVTACLATAFAFRLFPADLSVPVSWLWVPLFGGTVFVNAFGLAAITLMVPWEIITHYWAPPRALRVIKPDGNPLRGEIAPTCPSLTNQHVA